MPIVQYIGHTLWFCALTEENMRHRKSDKCQIHCTLKKNDFLLGNIRAVKEYTTNINNSHNHVYTYFVS